MLAGDASFTYNEATYTELAQHPWFSSYYPDEVFVRHPPLAFIALWAWSAVLGTSEWVMRLPGLLLGAGGVWCLWDGLRRTRGDGAAALVGVLAAASFPLHAYVIQVSMYPFAFLLAAGAARAGLLARPRQELVWTVGLALTHLFGFLFLATWLWRHRQRWRDFAVWAWPAALWLVAASVAGLLLNQQGDVIRLGPAGQVARGAPNAGDALVGRTWVHVASASVALLALNPVLLAAAWSVRRRFAHWALALAVLVPFFFIGAPYPRYAAVALPTAWCAGLWALTQGSGAWFERPWAWAAVVAVALLSVPVGFAYLEHGPDPRAAGDVPGVQDWRGAVALLPADAAVVATSGPTSTAYYLGADVASRSAAPYEIGLANGVTVWRIDAPADVGAVTADAYIVPSHWSLDAPGPLCGSAKGLRVYAHGC